MPRALALALLAALALPAAAYADAAPEPAVTETWGLEGPYVFNTATAHAGGCTVELLTTAANGFLAVKLGPTCAKSFPLLGKIVAWDLVTDGFTLLAADGTALVTLMSDTADLYRGYGEDGAEYTMKRTGE